MRSGRVRNNAGVFLDGTTQIFWWSSRANTDSSLAFSLRLDDVQVIASWGGNYRYSPFPPPLPESLLLDV